MKARHLAYVGLTLTALFWSGNFVAGRAIGPSIDPLTLNILRWCICLVLLLPLSARNLARQWRAVVRVWWLVLLLGATGIAGFHIFVYSGLRETTAVNGLLITALAPAAIMIGAVMIGASRPSVFQWIGALVSLAGVGVIVSNGDPAVIYRLQFNIGDLWLLGAVVTWAIYSLLLRKRPVDLDNDVLLTANIIAALAVMIPVALLLTPAPSLDFGAPVWLAIVYIGVFASLLAYLFWSYGVDTIGAAQAGQFIHLMPVFGPVLAVVLLGETIASTQVIGAILVLTGVVMVNSPRRAVA